MRSLENAIEVTHMSKTFKRVFDKPNTLKERLLFWNRSKPELFHVLNDININIIKGETVALIGTNGSGKSTLLKLMTKILYPNKGKVETQGKLTSLLELGAGFHPDFTGRENIYFNASIFGLTKKEINKRVDQIIEFSELGSFIDNPVRTYSSGMYMRLAFSVAINVDAEILLIDEILSVGDQHFQEKCFAKLEELRDSDKTIVIVSHSLDTISKLCNRAIWLYEGSVMEDGNTKEVIKDYLDRVVLDHKKKVIKVEKKDRYIGEMIVDTPKDNATYRIDGELCLEGWELSETDESVVEITIDEIPITGIERYERSDVIAIFEDRYGGYAANPNSGWKKTIKLNTFNEGEHIVNVKVLDEKKQIICWKDVTFNLK
ncbi:MAG: ABC transporter ATP-binding protein [Erysipelotrichaceae bacterium]